MFKFGRKYTKHSLYEMRNININEMRILTQREVVNYLRENGFFGNCDGGSPNGISGTHGRIDPGFRGYTPPPDKLKNINKYHFNGKYPKPHNI